MSKPNFKVTCPKCGSFNVSRERGLNGNDHCNSCMAVYPSQKAKLVVDKTDYDKLKTYYEKIVEANRKWQQRHRTLKEDFTQLSQLCTDKEQKLIKKLNTATALLKYRRDMIAELEAEKLNIEMQLGSINAKLDSIKKTVGNSYD